MKCLKDWLKQLKPDDEVLLHSEAGRHWVRTVGFRGRKGIRVGEYHYSETTGKRLGQKRGESPTYRIVPVTPEARADQDLLKAREELRTLNWSNLKPETIYAVLVLVRGDGND